MLLFFKNEEKKEGGVKEEVKRERGSGKPGYIFCLFLGFSVLMCPYQVTSLEPFPLYQECSSSR